MTDREIFGSTYVLECSVEMGVGRNGSSDARSEHKRAGGRFVSAYGMHVIAGPPSPYRRLVLDRDWHPVGPLNEWYRLRAGVGAPSTRDTYMRVLTPFFGFLLLNNWAWDRAAGRAAQRCTAQDR